MSLYPVVHVGDACEPTHVHIFFGHSCYLLVVMADVT